MPPQDAVTLVLIAIGTILRVWQYLANSSLWIDEAALAQSILNRPAGALFGRLSYGQVAFVGFLLVQKAAVSLFGASEYALRAFPLACGILSQMLFWQVAKRVRSIIIDYLDRIGQRLESVEVPGSSGSAIEATSGYLYDLSDPNRLTAASSSTFTIARDTTPRFFWMNCDGVTLMSESP